jgi:hypothetical protein
VVRLIIACLNEAYARVRVGKHLSAIFRIKNDLKEGDALSPLLFNFALEYVIKGVQVNLNGLKLNGTHQIFWRADDVHIFSESVYTINKNTEALVFASKETVLKENANKAKYISMYRDENAGQIHNIKIDNSSFERVEQYKYVGKTLTNKNSIQADNKSRLKPGNACYHSAQNLLFSSFCFPKI